MKAEIVREKEWNSAKRLQKRARGLHLPCPPVVSFEVELVGADGETKRVIKGKSNSFIRNALNIMAMHGAYGYLGGSSYANGSFSLKNMAGTTRNASTYNAIDPSTPASNTGETYLTLKAGYGVGAESLDDYKIGSEFGSGTAINQLTKGTTIRSTTYSAGVSKVITIYSRSFTNGYSASQDITEMALEVYTKYATSASELMMMMRDVFDTAVTVQPGETVILTYKIEVLF